MFRRRTTDDAADSGATGSGQGSHAVTAEDLAAARARAASAPKGRPTPKRSEAVAQRATLMNPPKDRREAAKLDRERTRKSRAEARTAMLSGDEKYLSGRDRGPVRRFVRDFIDSRRTVGEFYFILMIVILGLTLVNNPTIQNAATSAFLAATIVVVGEAVLTGRRLRAELATRFPENRGPHEGRKGAVFYGIMREIQLRRLRLPKPQVKPGATV